MPRVNSPTHALEDLTVGDLRRLLQWGGDESETLAVALASMNGAAQATAAHEVDWVEFQAYIARRLERRAAALASAAAAADKAKWGRGDGERMASRQTARAEAAEEFEQGEPELRFVEWQAAGRPEVHRLGVIQRAAQAVAEVIAS